MFTKLKNICMQPCKPFLYCIPVEKRIILYSCREKNKVVCVVPPMLDATLVGVPQPIRIVWKKPHVTDLATGYSFTYRPNPTVHGVDHNFTIPWYGIIL